MFKLYEAWYSHKADHIVEPKAFPDNSLNLKLPQIHAQKVVWHYENDAELFTLICIVKHYKTIHTLEIPYFPHARMDRVKDKKDVFTLKYFCDIINSLNIPEVYITDPHSNVTPALLNNCKIIYPNNYIKDVCKSINKEDLVFFFPDEGAMKRYSDNCEAPYTFGVKKRDWQTGKILSLEIMNAEVVKDKPVLIVDDICSYGGTFFYAAEALLAAGASEVFLYVTHCEPNIHKGRVFENISKVYTTDSIYVRPADARPEDVVEVIGGI